MEIEDNIFNDEYVIEEIKKEIWNFPKLNLNKTQIQPNLWDTIKWVLREKLIIISKTQKYQENFTV